MIGLFGIDYIPFGDKNSKLESIPDISKWNTKNVKYLGGFYKNFLRYRL